MNTFLSTSLSTSLNTKGLSTHSSNQQRLNTQSLNKTVTIVGCGWFGLPLAKALLAQGYTVYGSKRSANAAAELSQDNILGFELDLDQPVTPQLNQELTSDLASSASFEGKAPIALATALHTQAIIINIPPMFKASPGAYLTRLAKLKALMADHQYQKIIFISTTGVYPTSALPLTEADAKVHSQGSDILLQAEQVFSELSNACILRFAGLVGPGRHPGRFLAAKQGLAGASSPVNIVHQADCINAVSHVLASKHCATHYNICSPEHLSRQAFYTAASKHLSLNPPVFSDESQADKRVDGSKISSDLGMTYQFSSPLDMLSHC